MAPSSMRHVCAAAALAAVLCSMPVSLAQQSPAKAAWQELFAMDCKADMHVLSSSLFSQSWNLEFLQYLSQQWFNNAKQRATCACPSITDDEIIRRWVPGVEWALAQLDSANVDNTASACPDAFTTKWFDNSFSPLPRWLDLNIDVLPDTCSYATYMKGDPCLIKLDEPNTQTEIQFALRRCRDGAGGFNHLPFVSITCKGGLCAGLGKPCTVTDDCGHPKLQCQHLINGTNLEDAFHDIGIIDKAEIATCGGGLSFMNKITNKIRSFWGGAAASNAITDGQLRLCMPLEDDVKGATGGGDSDNNGGSNGGSGSGSASGSASSDSGLDAIPFTIEAEEKPASAPLFYACFATGCDSINVIGDDHCDPKCNNEACKWDGGDCKVKDTSGCPTADPNAECSGHGYCQDLVVTKKCYCMGGCPDSDPKYGRWSGDDCNTCPAGKICGNTRRTAQYCPTPPTNPYSYYAPPDFGDTPEKGYLTLKVGKKPGLGLRAWDGTMMDGNSAVSANRMSGFDFQGVSSIAEAGDGENLVFFHGNNGFGLNLNNPKLGGSWHAEHFTDAQNFLFEDLVRALSTCRANARGVTPLNDAQFNSRFVPFKSAYPLFAFWSPLSMAPGNDLPDFTVFGKNTSLGDHLRFLAPDSMKHQTYITTGRMAGGFAALTDLFLSTFEIYFGAKANPDYVRAMDYFGLGLRGAVPNILQFPTPCTLDSDCESGLKCTDLGGADFFNFDETFSGDMRDPIAYPQFGKRNFAPASCSSNPVFRKTLRRFVMGLNPKVTPDDGTALKFCFIDPSGIDTRGQSWAEARIKPGTCFEKYKGSDGSGSGGGGSGGGGSGGGGTSGGSGSGPKAASASTGGTNRLLRASPTVFWGAQAEAAREEGEMSRAARALLAPLTELAGVDLAGASMGDLMASARSMLASLSVEFTAADLEDAFDELQETGRLSSLFGGFSLPSVSELLKELPTHGRRAVEVAKGVHEALTAAAEAEGFDYEEPEDPYQVPDNERNLQEQPVDTDCLTNPMVINGIVGTTRDMTPKDDGTCESITNPAAFCPGGNGLVDNPATVKCALPVCTPQRDATKCCKPNAPCSTVKDPATFCASAQGNSLIQAAPFTLCSSSTCTASADAAKCCQKAATCETFPDAATNCKDYGDNGLIENPAGKLCAGTTCAKSDASTCCKPDAVCSSIVSPPAFCDARGGFLRKNPSTLVCQSAMCKPEADGATCCVDAIQMMFSQGTVADVTVPYASQDSGSAFSFSLQRTNAASAEQSKVDVVGTVTAFGSRVAGGPAVVTLTKSVTLAANLPSQAFPLTLKLPEGINTLYYTLAFAPAKRSDFKVVMATNINLQVKAVRAAPPGAITVLYPASGVKVGTSTVVGIMWKSQSIPNNAVKIQLMRMDAGASTPSVSDTLVASTDSTAGVYQWTVPSDTAPASTYYIVITSTDGTITDTGSMFTVQTTAPPAIAWTWTPPSGNRIHAGTQVDLTLSATSVADGSPLYVEIQRKATGSSTFGTVRRLSRSFLAAGDSTPTVAVTLPLMAFPGAANPVASATGVFDYRFRATLVDLSGQLSVVDSAAFGVDAAYAWNEGSWGTCTEPCGPGTQTRAVKCEQIKADGTKVDADDLFCLSALLQDTVPARSQVCNLKPCKTFGWLVGSWGQCSVACSGGAQTRTVQCKAQDNTDAADSLCVAVAGAKPAISQTCNPQACEAFDWSTGAWRDCPVQCGGGVRSRMVTCMGNQGTVGSDSQCAKAKPATTEACGTDTCPTFKWLASAFGKCDKDCGGGTATATVVCLETSSSTVQTDDKCDAASKPPTTKTCNTNVCRADLAYWKVSGSQGACSKTCGGGTAAQTVICVDADGNTVANSKCEARGADAGTKPAASVPCNTQKCDPCAVNNGDCDKLHGTCSAGSGKCVCSDFYTGLFCDTPPNCKGELDYKGTCCLSKVLDVAGLCCSNGLKDNQGKCCATSVDACGVCGGTSTEGFDIFGVCCPAGGVMDAGGSCCKSGKLDACGVCDGDGSSCGVQLGLVVKPPAGVSDVTQVCNKGTVEYNKYTLTDFPAEMAPLLKVSTDRITVDEVDCTQVRRALAEGRRLASTALDVDFAVSTVSSGGTAASDTNVASSDAIIANAATAAASGATVVSVGTVAAKPVCGNNICEAGEQCKAGQVDGCCANDCVVVQECPKDPTTGATCGGTDHGTCVRASGTCSCFTDRGYTGSACTDCASGFVPNNGRCEAGLALRVANNPTYAWETPAFGACSKTCGGGTQTRTVTCKDNLGNAAAEGNCAGTKPAESQACNTQACSTGSSSGGSSTGGSSSGGSNGGNGQQQNGPSAPGADGGGGSAIPIVIGIVGAAIVLSIIGGFWYLKSNNKSDDRTKLAPSHSSGGAAIGQQNPAYQQAPPPGPVFAPPPGAASAHV